MDSPHDTADTGNDCVGINSLLSSGQEIEVLELDKSDVVQRRWLHQSMHNIPVVQVQPKDASNSHFSRSLREWRKAIGDAFLPVGFPHSVSPDYLAYQTYDSLQAFFSTISSLLANRALLQGLGVGDAGSSATFAMLLTILKDIMSRIATIVFAHRFGLRIEPDAKRYRFLADLFNDTAFFLELYSPYLSPWGKVIALSTGEGLRALCGVAAGASKAALSVHFAKHDNLAELNAKEASQETAVGLVGLLVGTIVVKTIEDHNSVVCLMVILVFAHLWMNYLGVRSVCMTTFNRQRATILFSQYLKTGEIMSPSQVAQREHIIFWSPVVRNQEGILAAYVEFGQSYGHATTSHSAQSSTTIVDGAHYTMFAERRASGLTRLRILLHTRATASHAIIAWYAALRYAWKLRPGMTPPSSTMETAAELDGDLEPAFLGGQATLKPGHADQELLSALAGRGWNLGTQAFETHAPVRLLIQPKAKKEE